MTGLDQEEQQMLADSLTRWTDGVYSAQRRAQAIAHPHGCDPANWQELGQMGWLGLALDQAWGGMQGGPELMGSMAEGFGRVLLQEPYVTCGVMALSLLNELADAASVHLSIDQLLQGQTRLAFMAWEPGQTGTLAPPQMVALENGSCYLLQGEKAWMPGAAGADFYLLLAQLPNSADLGVFLLPRQALGLDIEQATLYDGRHAARLRATNAPATLLLRASAQTVLEKVGKTIRYGLIAYCAELAGVAHSTLSLTRDYVCERRQFGQTIGSQQVVQHRLVDLYVLIEEVQALWRAAARDPSDRYLAALMVQTQDMADRLWQEAIQLHGAIGMTEEYALAAYVRRLAIANAMFGQRWQYLEQLANVELGEA